MSFYHDPAEPEILGKVISDGQEKKLYETLLNYSPEGSNPSFGETSFFHPIDTAAYQAISIARDDKFGIMVREHIMVADFHDCLRFVHGLDKAKGPEADLARLKLHYISKIYEACRSYLIDPEHCVENEQDDETLEASKVDHFLSKLGLHSAEQKRQSERAEDEIEDQTLPDSFFASLAQEQLEKDGSSFLIRVIEIAKAVLPKIARDLKRYTPLLDQLEKESTVDAILKIIPPAKNEAYYLNWPTKVDAFRAWSVQDDIDFIVSLAHDILERQTGNPEGIPPVTPEQEVLSEPAIIAFIRNYLETALEDQLDILAGPAYKLVIEKVKELRHAITLFPRNGVLILESLEDYFETEEGGKALEELLDFAPLPAEAENLLAGLPHKK